MKLRIIAVLLLATCAGVASEDLYMKSSHLDGLPLKIDDTRLLRQPLDKLSLKIDLTPAFDELGVKIPEGGFILYDTRTGWLLRRLNEVNHDAVDGLLDGLYRRERAVAIAQAYLDLLKPLAKGERTKAVLRIGYFPDPLVAAHIAEVRQMRPPPDEDPFFQQPPAGPRPLTAEQQARLGHLENLIGELLDRSLTKLSEQLELIGPSAPATPKPDAEQGPPSNGEQLPK